MKVRNCVIVDGVRSAFTKGGRGGLEAARMDEAGAELVRMLFERNPKATPEMIEEFGVANARNDIELAEYLLDNAGVALVPGSAFGAPGYVRISFATSMDILKDALARLTKALTA